MVVKGLLAKREGDQLGNCACTSIYAFRITSIHPITVFLTTGDLFKPGFAQGFTLQCLVLNNNLKKDHHERVPGLEMFANHWFN